MPVRFRILGVLFVMCFVNYLLRNNLSIAIPSIQKEFGFTNAEIGWILGSFNFSYALLQIPGRHLRTDRTGRAARSRHRRVLGRADVPDRLRSDAHGRVGHWCDGVADRDPAAAGR